MKKLGLALMGLLMIASTGAFAQASFGVKAGLNLSKMSEKMGGNKVDDIKFKPGINIGAFADLKLSDLLAVEAGLQVEMKGFKMKDEDEWFGTKVTSKLSTNLIYVTIPVDVRLNFGDFYVLAGPYLGIGASGKVKSTIESDGDKVKETETLEFGNDKKDSDLKRMDIGLGFGAGYEFTDNLGARLGYDLGLTNLLPGGDKDNKTTNGSINLSVTYRF